jgi:hypothetical protein
MSEKLAYNLSEDSITIYYDGKPHTIRKDNANFDSLRSAIFEARYEDIPSLLDIKSAVEDFVEGDVEIRDEVVYYKGKHRLHGVVVDKLLEMLRSGMKDSTPITNYIGRLMDNPSSNSVDELYTFLGYRSLPITPDGKVLGYKGVQGDFWSNTGNADTIVLQGETNDRHQIYNGVGETIEIQRRSVDDNKDNHCSHGLHIGSYDYANGWSGNDGRLLLVEFDPQDAVSVPTDCDFQKLRVCKYKVVADITDSRKELDKVVYEPNKPIYGSDNDDDFNHDDSPIDGDWDGTCCDDEDEYGDCECEEDSTQVSRLAVRNYIENKIENGEVVTLKLISSLQVCREEGWKVRDCAELVEDMGFILHSSDNEIMSNWEVSE